MKIKKPVQDLAPVIRNHFNYNWMHTFSDVAPSRSLTVPNQSMTLKEIISRFVRKLAIPSVPMVNVDGDVSQYDKLSRFEKIDAARKLASDAAKLRATAQSEGLKKASERVRVATETAIEKRATELANLKTSQDVKTS